MERDLSPTSKLNLGILGTTCLLLFGSNLASAIQPDLKTLPIGLARHERSLPAAVPFSRGETPKGPVRSLGEWEESEAVMTLWTNTSWVKALAAHGAVKLIADSPSDQAWWERWLNDAGIPRTNVSYFIAPTDSIWVRDYGPWWILDGDGRFGIVDNVYNRPRPQDDKFPPFVASQLGVPLFQPGLVHTGGNYYNDGYLSAFSSTLVYTENRGLSIAQVDTRMKDFLGVSRYTTSPLGERITIEHLDTFGKLVAPDTWVFSEFPAGSKFKNDSDKMVKLLQALKSPYGTPYKIHRMPMWERGAAGREDYRAYINSFISNSVLYYPVYGAASDEQAKKIYQAALPGYKIVGVSAPDTEWGDSVHCRSRNILKKDTIFLFPGISSIPSNELGSLEMAIEAWPSPGSNLTRAPQVHWTSNGVEQEVITAAPGADAHHFVAKFPALPKGTKIAAWVEATDDRGHVKRAPRLAPQMAIEVAIGQ